MYNIGVYNVNEALDSLHIMLRGGGWRNIAPRGGLETLEWCEPVTTVYRSPCERVLFSPTRDANPYFHMFEALWILAGMDTVDPLAYFNRKMADYSDDGVVFHAPYGNRLRFHWSLDQVSTVIQLLKDEPDTRRAVMSIWDPGTDAAYRGKDMPCNTTIFFKVRENKLNMLVACRSNDALWGAYGANAVQFSTLQEYIAICVGVEVGTYSQVSDSFHVYTGIPLYTRFMEEHLIGVNPYSGANCVQPFPLLQSAAERRQFDDDNALLWNPVPNWLVKDGKWNPYSALERQGELQSSYFKGVVLPMLRSFVAHKEGVVDLAQRALDGCRASDWRRACLEWLERRHGV